MVKPRFHLPFLCASMALVALASTDCTRSMLQDAANSYIAAQAAAQYTAIKYRSPSLVYTENNKTADITRGILSQSLTIAHNRSSLDTTQCATYTELIIVDAKNPSVIGTQIRFTDNNITKMESIVTHKGDWAFNATSTLMYASQENDWGMIPTEKRDNRTTLQAAADAYLDDFMNGTAAVPWGTPCARLEGGAYINGSCNVGVPTGIPFLYRRYVIDEAFGSVDVFSMLDGDKGMPDSHEYRVQSGKIRYVHTMSVNLTKGMMG